jgi:hypothetical protein
MYGLPLALAAGVLQSGGQMSMQNTVNTEVVNDPVSHISISGVHGRDELNDRLAHARTHRATAHPFGPLALSAVVGAVIMYLFTR